MRGREREKERKGKREKERKGKREKGRQGKREKRKKRGREKGKREKGGKRHGLRWGEIRGEKNRRSAKESFHKKVKYIIFLLP